MMFHSTLLFLLGAASVSNAYVQLVMRSADRNNQMPLHGYIISRTPHGLTAVRNASPLEVGPSEFWSATWMVYHNRGSGRGKCNTIPCKYPTDMIDGDSTLYNMHDAMKLRKAYKKLSPTNPHYLRRLEFLGVPEGKEEEREMGLFRPADEGKLRTKVHKWWSGNANGERPDWRFLTFMSYDGMMSVARTHLLQDMEFKFIHDGGGRDWDVCYKASSKDSEDLDNVPIRLLPASRLGNDPSTAAQVCHPIQISARTLLPTYGSYIQMQDAEKLRRDKSSTTGHDNVGRFKVRLTEEEESILVGGNSVSEDEPSDAFNFDEREERGGDFGIIEEDFTEEEQDEVRQRATKMDGNDWEEKLQENPRCADGTRKGFRTLWKC